MSRVVVLLAPVYLHNSESAIFAARFRSLGLTAYGDTREEALAVLKRLFSFFVRKRREDGTLESFLDKSGVEWYPEERYPQGKGPVEYMDGSHYVPQTDKSQAVGGWVPDATLAA